MPCSDAGAEEYYRGLERDKVKRIDQLTRLLCYQCGEQIYRDGAEATRKSFEKNSALSQWWEDHFRADMVRVVGEMVRALHKGEAPATMVDDFIAKAEKVHAVSRWHKESFFPACLEWAVQQQKITPETL
jgi:hypothetical protein